MSATTTAKACPEHGTACVVRLVTEPRHDAGARSLDPPRWAAVFMADQPGRVLTEVQHTPAKRSPDALLSDPTNYRIVPRDVEDRIDAVRAGLSTTTGDVVEAFAQHTAALKADLYQAFTDHRADMRANAELLASTVGRRLAERDADVLFLASALAEIAWRRRWWQRWRPRKPAVLDERESNDAEG